MDSSKVKKQQFLYGMVTAEFFPYENYEIDYEAYRLAETIREQTERPEDAGVLTYTELALYSYSMVFNWQEDVPEEYRNLEIWWGMYKGGQASPGDCYLYFISELANEVISDWLAARRKAQAIWKPLSRRPASELTPEQQADPNLESART